MTTRKTMKAIAASIIAISANSYAAADQKGPDYDKKQDAPHQHESNAMYGGLVSVVKDIHYELVAKPASLELYLTNQGKPIDAKDCAATVTLLCATGKKEAELVHAGGNKLSVDGNFRTGAHTKALAAIAMPGQSLVNVRFTLQ